MRHLRFQARYIDPILSGEKTVTFRRHTTIKPGEIVALACRYDQPPFAVADVVDVERLRVVDVSEADILADGFPDRASWRAALRKLYGGQRTVFVVRFRLRSIDDEQTPPKRSKAGASGRSTPDS